MGEGEGVLPSAGTVMAARTAMAGARFLAGTAIPVSISEDICTGRERINRRTYEVRSRRPGTDGDGRRLEMVDVGLL